MTAAQDSALRETIELGGTISRGLGVRRDTVAALVKLGLMEWIETRPMRRELAPAGWTGREYLVGTWAARVTDAGRKAVA